ncbi:hypothetical protein [uncultured Microbulbifer sp.]|uniref:hypothetical protein n=1 Tax=uncultured Microbulbifer sp. TaxID=348147 RepID=UPI002635FBDC|nr:hypothetical protein [uncultured Microbulbifer sp.]
MSELMEREIIILRNSYDHLNDLLNHSLLEVQGPFGRQHVIFHSHVHRKLFFILLVDFLSKTDKRGPVGNISFLEGLKDITEKPLFSTDRSESPLCESVLGFIQWLRQTVEIEIWLPSIGENIALKVQRLTYLKMCGDISKHNYLRSIGVVSNLQEALLVAGISVTQSQALLVLRDFQDRFDEDILIYLASHICEMLNKICWGIYKYILPEFNRSYQPKPVGFLGNAYQVPPSISSEYAIDCYWSLMNDIRRGPIFEEFETSSGFKEYY